MKKAKRKHQVAPMFDVVPEHVDRFVKVGDIRDLILWTLNSEVQGPPAPKWITVQNRTAIERVVSIMIPGLPFSHFIKDSESPRPCKVERHPGVPVLSEFAYAWPTRAPGSHDRLESAITEFTRVPLTSGEKKTQRRQRLNNGSPKKHALVPLAELKLTAETMRSLGYPIEAVDDTWVAVAPPISESSQPPALFAIDCEMVDTASGKVLARVSIVDENCNSVYETFVLPDEPIVDYVTQYSGITPEKLEGVTTRLHHVQEWITKNIRNTDILVGHSVESDLRALRMSFPNIIDTAIIFTHTKGLPWRPSLRWLASKYLETTIQAGTDGHDSIEDAQTCIRLLQLKREKGLEFGSRQTSTSLTEKLAQDAKTSAIVDYGVPRWDQGFAKSVVSCTSDSEAAKQVAAVCDKYNYVFARFRELEQALRWYDGGSPQDIDMDKVYAELNKNISTIKSALPPNTAFIIWTGHGDPTELQALRSKQRTYQTEYATKKWDEIENPFTDEDGAALTRAAHVARMGLSFLEVVSPEKVKARKLNDGSAK